MISNDYSLAATPPNAQRIPEYARDDKWVRSFLRRARRRSLPSNVALEFPVQYAGMIVFGTPQIIDDANEKRRALYGLVKSYFPAMAAGVDYRPSADQELSRTSVYAILVESCSG